MSFIVRAFPLLLTGVGVTFSPQGIKKAKQWYKAVFNAPPSQLVVSSPVTEPTVNSSEKTESASSIAEQPSSQVSPVPEVVPVPPATPTIMEVLKEAGYEGCELLKGLRGRKLLLYVCWKEGSIKTPYIFHYDRSKIKLGEKAKADQITDITYHSASSVIMKFKDEIPEKTHKLESPLPWMRKFQGQTLIPENECTFTRDNEYNSSSVYTLNCKSQPIQKGIQM